MSNDNDKYKFQGVPISDLIESGGNIEANGYSGLKYKHAESDLPESQVGPDSFVNVFKINNDALPSTIKAKEYDITNSTTTIPEWANAFRFRMQTNAGNKGAVGDRGQDGTPGDAGKSWKDQVLVSHTGWGFYGYQRHEHRGAEGGPGGAGGIAGAGGAGGNGGKGKEVYSNFFPIESGCTIEHNTTGFKIKKGNNNVFNISINAANDGQNGYPGGNGTNGQKGNDANSAINKWNKQQGRNGEAGNKGQNGKRVKVGEYLDDGQNTLTGDGNGRKGDNGNDSNMVANSNVMENLHNEYLISSFRNSTEGASTKIYFFKQPPEDT